jgi:hypothetical protein
MVVCREWLFVVIGPVGVIFGVYVVAMGHWVGAMFIAVASWWTVARMAASSSFSERLLAPALVGERSRRHSEAVLCARGNRRLS